jgi:hypothetical protein
METAGHRLLVRFSHLRTGFHNARRREEFPKGIPSILPQIRQFCLIKQHYRFNKESQIDDLHQIDRE